MAIAHDANSSANDSETNTLSWSHTCTGSDRALVVHAANNGGLTVSSVTYNSVSMTAVASGIANGNANCQNWILVAPATGSNTVLITYSGSGNFLTSGASSYTGVDQSTPTDAAGAGSTGSSTNSNDSVTSGSNWHVGTGVTAGEAGAFTANSPTVLAFTTGSEQNFAAGGYAPTGTAISFTNDNADWACQAFSLKAASAGGATLEPAAEQISFSASAPLLVLAFNFTPAAEQLTFSSSAPTVARGLTIEPPAEQIAFSAATPVRIINLIRGPPAAQLTFSATTPVLLQTFVEVPSAAQLSFSSSLPQLILSTELTPAAAQIVLSSSAAALVLGIARTPGAAQLAFSASAPDLIYIRTLIPAAAQLTFSATAPEVLKGFTFVPAATQLTFSASAPVLLQTFVEIPAAAQLVFSGSIPIVIANPPVYEQLSFRGRNDDGFLGKGPD